MKTVREEESAFWWLYELWKADVASSPVSLLPLWAVHLQDIYTLKAPEMQSYQGQSWRGKGQAAS